MNAIVYIGVSEASEMVQKSLPSLSLWEKLEYKPKSRGG
jgi:hypothetical protein